MKYNKAYTPVLISAVLILLSVLLPVPAGLTRGALYVVGVFASTVLLWMTIGVSWPSVFCIAALFFIPGMKPATIISASIGNQTITFLIFTFCMSWALEQTQFIRRCAIKFLSVKAAAGRPWLFMILYFTSILVLGSVMSTTVIVLIYLTINEEIFSILKLEKGSKVASMMTMGLVIVSGISGAITPIAHVFPLMAISLYEKAVGTGTILYWKYMAAGIPTGFLVMLLTTALFRFVLKPDVKCLAELDISELKAATPKADAKEKLTVGVFASVCALWILPELLSGLFPTVCAFISSYGTVTPPMLGCILLCILHVEDKPVMDIRKALSSISWLSILMGAAALAIGAQLSNNDLGITATVTAAMEPLLATLAPFALVLIMVFFTGIMTNVASNMVTVMLACTVALPIAMNMANISTPALATVIGMTSAYAFATPPAMTTVALGLGSGWTGAGALAKYGFMVLFIACMLISCIAYPIAAAIM